jgi:hypothetical protein
MSWTASSLAGFEVILIGSFGAITEGPSRVASLKLGAQPFREHTRALAPGKDETSSYR